MPLACEKGPYHLVGVVLACSLAHGGPAGNFFSATLYDSLAYVPGVRPPHLKDVPDHVLKQIIQVSLIFNCTGRLECTDAFNITDFQENYLIKKCRGLYCIRP